MFTCLFFFWVDRENLQIAPTAHSGAEGSVRFLTNNPARSFSNPSFQVHDISFEPFPRLWQTVSLVSGLFTFYRPRPSLSLWACQA